MWKRISRQTYGLACLAATVAIVLTACETPAPEVAAPTVSEEIGDISVLAADTSRSVSLNSAFKGEKLFFRVRSSPRGVVDLEIATDNRSIVIRANRPGTATITVTATNSGGSESQSFKVTVPQPPPPTTTTPPPPISEEPEIDADYTIKLGESVKHTLSSGRSLQEPASGGVTAVESQDGESGNVWLITAKKKGTHKVIVLEKGKSVGTITVEVPNSRPLRQDQTDANQPVLLGNPKILLASAEGTVNLTTDGAVATPDITNYFHDDDTDDTIRYRIEDKPSWFLVETDEKGFLKDADDDDTVDPFQLKYEVLQRVVPSNERDYEFSVSLYASDGEEEATRPVVIEFNVGDASILPLPGMYNVDQDASGNFRDAKKDGSYNNRLEVGPRRDPEVIHTVTFRGVEGTLSESGFVFVENAFEDIASDDRPSSGTDSIYYRDGRNVVKLVGGTTDPERPTGYQAPGTRYFLIRGSSAVVVEGGAADSITIGAGAKVSFSLKSGSSGSITIEYKIWLNKDVVDNSNDENNGKTTSTKTTTKTLSISVRNCSSPPNPIADCP